MARIRVALQHNPYSVTVGHQIGKDLRAAIKQVLGSSRLFLLLDATFDALHGETLRRQLGVKGKRLVNIVVPSGEKSKSASTAAKLYDHLLDCGVSRDDVVLAAGGGVTTDLAGYVASTVLRGLRWIAVPTTLLGMVDAAIGGKTGINHRAGKNLIGTFWQPAYVHCDTFWLNTLSRRELIAGMGEVVKYAGLAGEPFMKKVVRLIDSGNLLTQARLGPVVAASIRYKAAVVAADEREGGRRMWLNLGHTFAHGIERALGYGRLLHGEAVLIGLWAACDLSVRLKPRQTQEMLAWRSIIEHFLRSIPYRTISPDAVWDAMHLDKKRRGATLRFVLLSRPGEPLIHDRVAGKLARQSLTAALSRYATIGGADAAHSGR